MSPLLEQGAARLKERLGPALVETGEGLVATPPDPEALVEVLAIASDARLRVRVEGEGLRRDWGNPTDTDLVVSTRALTRVIEYAPDDMVVTAEAGLTLESLNTLLGTRLQVLPLEVPHPERTTLGGLVAAAPLSLARAGYGDVKDWLIGLTVASPSGELVKGGGKVVKNVAGYDLCKLYAGSLGTLGAIATVTFRVRPSWEATALIAATARPTEASALLEAVQTTHLAPAVNVLRLEGETARFVLGFDGFQETVDWQIQEAARRFEELGATDVTVRRDAAAREERRALATALHGPQGMLAVRSSVLPSELLAFHARAIAIGARHGLALRGPALAPQGTLFLQGEGEPAARAAWLHEVRAIARAEGGHVTVEGHSGWPQEVDAFMLDPIPRTLMRRIQAGLDPGGLMAPGRFRLEGDPHGAA